VMLTLNVMFESTVGFAQSRLPTAIE